jgi:cytochrome c5
MSAHEEHTSFIKTPQQLIVVVLLSFIVPVVSILLLVKLVLSQPSADPNAMAPENVKARLQPVARLEFGAASAKPGARSGEDIVKATCNACHQAGVAGAPKIGDKAQWAPRFKDGLKGMLEIATKGKGAMPPKGGDGSLTDAELTRAIVFMANQSGGSFKEPAAAAASKKSK